MRAVLTVVAAIAVARPAAADPLDARVLTVPTAWLLPADAAAVTLGADRREAMAIGRASLGGLAEIELGVDSDVRACAGCTARPVALWLGRAAFRIGARQDAWFAGMPAVVLAVRTTFAAHGHAVHDPEVSHAYAVASRDLGVIRLHAGLDAIAASVDRHRGATALRPLAAVELHPPMYPKSSLLGDLAWEPELDAAHGPEPRWLLGIGVRYQAFSWASIELAVRGRQGDDLGDSTVMIRVNAVRR